MTCHFQQFWDAECIAARYFAIRASDFDPRCFVAKTLIRHASGAYFSIKQMSAVYDDNQRQKQCEIILFADAFISEGMLHDILVDAGATSISIETPPQDCARWWLMAKMTSIWDDVANSKLKYYHTGIPVEGSNQIVRDAAAKWIQTNKAGLQNYDTSASFSSKLDCFALDDDIATRDKCFYMGLPPEDQIEAFKLWMKHIWGTDCPIETC